MAEQTPTAEKIRIALQDLNVMVAKWEEAEVERTRTAVAAETERCVAEIEAFTKLPFGWKGALIGAIRRAPEPEPRASKAAIRRIAKLED